MINYIILFILFTVIGFAIGYIRNAKKKGIQCIGCPDAPKCAGNCAGCSGCSSQEQ